MNPISDLDRLPQLDEGELRDYLASKMRRERRLRKLSQVEFARQAGIPLRTYKRFETDGRASLDTFLRALRAIGQTRYLFMLFPQALPKKVTLEARIDAIAARQTEFRHATTRSPDAFPLNEELPPNG